MRKKGFTLIELLAVIVILAIIALIATPIILNMINDARKSAAVDSAYGYIEAIDYNNSMAQLNNKYDRITSDSVTKINSAVKVKGTKPTSGNVKVDASGRVIEADLCIDGFNIVYYGNEAEATESDKCRKSDTEKESLKGTPILDRAKSLVYTDGVCKTDGTTYQYMGGCYIKGTSTNNYIWYNGFMWRIMGINSDNTVRLITDESVTSIAYGEGGTGLTYSTNKGYINEWLNDYFYENLSDIKGIISNGTYFCSETTNDISLTIDTARTTCKSGQNITAKVGTISIDEYLLSNSSNSYLNIKQSFWTMTPYNASLAWYINYNGSTDILGVSNAAYGVRPIINVVSTSVITKGSGTSLDYFVLSENKSTDITGTIGTNATSGEYVNLEGKTYRVVSKESDKLKLILDGYYEETIGKSYTMSYGSNYTFTLDSGIGKKLNEDVLVSLGLSDSDKILETIWYQGDAMDHVKYTYALEQTDGVSAKVGLIRAGEMLSNQSSTILTKNYTTESTFVNATTYWTMSKYIYNSRAWYVYSLGNATDYGGVSKSLGLRPVIVVKSKLPILGGNGTPSNPYQI